MQIQGRMPAARSSDYNIPDAFEKRQLVSYVNHYKAWVIVFLPSTSSSYECFALFNVPMVLIFDFGII